MPYDPRRWQPDGPKLRCKACSKRITNNALGRASHERACPLRGSYTITNVGDKSFVLSNVPPGGRISTN